MTNEDNGVALPNAIQISAAINPGNSGGALADVLAGLRPGQAVTVADGHPGGARRTVRVTLGQFPG